MHCQEPVSTVTILRTCPAFTSERPRRVQHDGQEPPEAHVSRAVGGWPCATAKLGSSPVVRSKHWTRWMLQSDCNGLPAPYVYGLGAQSTGGGSEPLVRSSELGQTRHTASRTEGVGGGKVSRPMSQKWRSLSAYLVSTPPSLRCRRRILYAVASSSAALAAESDDQSWNSSSDFFLREWWSEALARVLVRHALPLRAQQGLYDITARTAHCR